MPPEPIKEVTKRTTYALVAEIIKHALIWLFPLIAPALAVLVGWLEHIPWLYVIVAAAVTFGAGATGALRLSELRFRVTPINKLGFTNPVFAADYTRDKRTGQVRTIDKAQIGFQLQNFAHFEMSYLIDEVQTSFEGMINTKPDKYTSATLVPPNGASLFRDTTIDVKGITLDKASYEGHLRFRVRYGYPGYETNEIYRNILIAFVIETKTGNCTLSYHDAVENVRGTR